MGPEKCRHASVAKRPVSGSGPDTLVTADGCTLHRREWSTHSARATVVLVHGFTASTDNAAVVRQAEALRDQGFHVVSYDSRGHGRSSGVCTLGDRESYDVAAAVEWAKLGGRRVIVVGASMGAVAALRYAASGDEQLAGVIAISAPATWRTPPSPGAIFLFALTRTAIGWQYTTRHLGIRMAPTWVAWSATWTFRWRSSMGTVTGTSASRMPRPSIGLVARPESGSTWSAAWGMPSTSGPSHRSRRPRSGYWAPSGAKSPDRSRVRVLSVVTLVFWVAGVYAAPRHGCQLLACRAAEHRAAVLFDRRCSDPR
jgi:pimeloyl-ACP methyl ester carboxylesterase